VALPRDGRPLAEQMDGWGEVASNIRSVCTARPPRARDVRPGPGPDAGAAPALDPGDLSDVPPAYRRLEQYHEGLLRLIDAAARVTEGFFGTPEQRSWTPGVLHDPRRPGATPGASFDHVPLKHVSYSWASTFDLQTGGCRVVVVHDGDGASSPPGASRPTLSAFAAYVVRQREERIYRVPGWGSADALIASATGYSPRQWEDGAPHVAETREGTLRFGGFSQEMAQILGSSSPEPWLTRLRALISGVRGA
jgi:hypothetical protein